MNKFKIIFLSLTVTLSGCMTTTNFDVSGVKRKQLMLYPSAQYAQETNKYYQDLMNKHRVNRQLDNKPELSQRVLKIAKNITKQVQEIKPETANWKWEIHVINTQEPNAFCAGEGKMGVYEGVITKLKLTDDELAAIIGHEIAHALLEHGRERASRDVLTNVFLSKLDGGGQALGYYLTQLGLSFPFSRSQESEADLLGLQIAAKAGYDPRAAITLWEKFGKLDQSSNNKFLSILSTHPMPDKRKQDLALAAPKFIPFYEAAKKK